VALIGGLLSEILIRIKERSTSFLEEIEENEDNFKNDSNENEKVLIRFLEIGYNVIFSIINVNIKFVFYKLLNL